MKLNVAQLVRLINSNRMNEKGRMRIADSYFTTKSCRQSCTKLLGEDCTGRDLILTEDKAHEDNVIIYSSS